MSQGSADVWTPLIQKLNLTKSTDFLNHEELLEAFSPRAKLSTALHNEAAFMREIPQVSILLLPKAFPLLLFILLYLERRRVGGVFRENSSQPLLRRFLGQKKKGEGKFTSTRTPSPPKENSGNKKRGGINKTERGGKGS